MKRLSKRRYDLCVKFAKKSSLHLKFQNWFSFSPEVIDEPAQTRSDLPLLKYKPVKTRTDRYKKSPIPYLTDILNIQDVKKQTK